MFTKSFLNITLSDSEDPGVDQQLSGSVSFINISLSSLDDSVDNLLNPVNDIIKCGSVIESKIYAEPKEVKTNVKRIVNHFLKHRQSYSGLEDVCKIVNQTPKATIKVPTTKYLIKQLVEPSFQCKMNVECPDCKQICVGESNEMECCGKKLRTTNTDHFVTISLKQQLRRSIEDNFEEIMSFNPSNERDTIGDVHDAIQFRRTQAKYENHIKTLSLTVNTDGAKIYSTVFNKSVWPVHLQQNYLLPKNRLRTCNIMLVALYFGEKYPDIHQLFYPMLKELRDIQDDGGICIERNGKKQVFMPVITSCCCDLPAKVKVQCSISHAGYNACGYCMHPGILIKPKEESVSKQKAYVRYTYKCSTARTHASILDAYKQNPLRSTFGASAMIAAKHFDLVNGFVIDYMHCVLLGVTKRLIDLWFNSKNHRETYYMAKRNQHKFDKKLCLIKPTSAIGVRPISVFNRSNYKAKHYRILLLFYLRCCLPGCLGKELIDHFQLLSSAIFILLKENITNDEINEVEINLDKFVKSFEVLYGQQNVTMNLHLLLHIAESVRNSGPLWSNSAFTFESNNGELLRSNHAKLNILHSMAWKYSVKPAVSESINIHPRGIQVKEKFHIDFTPTERLLLESSFHSMDEITTHKILKIGSEKFSSMAAKDLNTVDFFVELQNIEIFGAIKFFICSKNNIYFMLERFITTKTIDHIRVIKSSNVNQIYAIESIKTKLIYMKINNKVFVSKLPNIYEEN